MQRNTLFRKSADAHAHAVRRWCGLALGFTVSCNFRRYGDLVLKEHSVDRNHLTSVEVFKEFVYNMCVWQGESPSDFFFCLQYLPEDFFFKYMLKIINVKVSLNLTDMYLPIQAKVMSCDNSN